jgi:hypothetical protein
MFPRDHPRRYGKPQEHDRPGGNAITTLARSQDRPSPLTNPSCSSGVPQRNVTVARNGATQASGSTANRNLGRGG